MAGESPDKSEQRKSSGEATHEQDPRFAVFRESAAAGAPDATKDASAGADGSAEAAVDHSTAVLTVRGTGGASEPPEAAVAPVAPPEGPSPAPEPELESTTEPKSEAGSRPDATAASEPVAADRTESDANAETDVAPAKRGALPAEPGTESGPARPVGDRVSSGPDADASPAEPGTDSGREPGAEAAGSGANVDVAPAKPGTDSGRKAGTVAASAAGSGADADPAEPGTDSGKRVGKTAPAAPAAGSGSDRPVGDRASSGRNPGAASAEPDGKREPGAEAAGANPDVAPAKPGTDPGRKAGSAAASAEPGGKRETAPAAAAGGSGTDRPAGGQASSNADADVASAKAGSGGAGRTGGGSGVSFRRVAQPASAGPGGGSAEADAPDEVGVDRKTAVFKAVKRPGVDQPTAMLKLPPQPPAPSPEAPAERTSKFVPLRSDEAQPQPQAKAPALPAPPAAGVAEAERTRQQPMPPLPPLDLLAELTNKPAPPETPTRTVVRRVKIWTPLLVLVLIIFAVVQAVRPLPVPSLNLTAKPTYTFEGDKPALPWPGEGQGFMAATGLGTVGSFGEQKAVPIGSVAKAMTAYVVLKDKPLAKGADGPAITVDAKAEEDGGLDAQGESTLNTVKEGDKLTQHDALAALMIPSANNIARLLARWNADGSEEAFVKKMNDTAEELGMKNTTYTDPSGLDATTVSSAEDQVKLGQKLVEIEALMDITKMPEWKDPSGKTWRNYNTLVPYDGALGIKTGSTTKAGGNLLFAAHKTVGDTDQLIVGAVLGQHTAPIIDTVNAVSKDVMLATQDELEGATIVKKGQVVGELDNGMGTKSPLVATEDVKAVGWSGLTVKLELSDEGKDLPQSAAAGTHVGLLTVGEGKSRVEVAVALQGDLAEPGFGDKLTRVG